MTPPKGKAPPSPVSSGTRSVGRGWGAPGASASHSERVLDVLVPQGVATGCLIKFQPNSRLRLSEPGRDTWDGFFRLAYATALMVVNKGKMLVRPYSPGGAFDVISFAASKLREHKSQLEKLKALTFVEQAGLRPRHHHEHMPGSDPGASLRPQSGGFGYSNGPFNTLDARRRSHVARSADWGPFATSLNDSFGESNKFRSGSPLDHHDQLAASPEPPVQYRNSLSEEGYPPALFEGGNTYQASPPDSHGLRQGTSPMEGAASMPNSVMNALLNNAIPEELRGAMPVGSQSLPRGSFPHSVTEMAPPSSSVMASLLLGGGQSPPGGSPPNAAQQPQQQQQSLSSSYRGLSVETSHQNFFSQAGLSGTGTLGLTAFKPAGGRPSLSTNDVPSLAAVKEEPTGTSRSPQKRPPGLEPIRVDIPSDAPPHLGVNREADDDAPGWLIDQDENEGDTSPLPGQENDPEAAPRLSEGPCLSAAVPNASEYLPSEFMFFKQSALIANGVQSRTKLELCVATCVITCASDASPVVRKEALLALSKLVLHPRHSLAFEAVLAVLEAVKRGSSDMLRDIQPRHTAEQGGLDVTAQPGLRASPSTASLFPSTPKAPHSLRGQSTDGPFTPEHPRDLRAFGSPGDGRPAAAPQRVERRSSEPSSHVPESHFGSVGDEFWEVAQRNSDDYWGPEVDFEEDGEEGGVNSTIEEEKDEEEDVDDLGLDIEGIAEDAAGALYQHTGGLAENPSGSGRSRGISFVARAEPPASEGQLPAGQRLSSIRGHPSGAPTSSPRRPPSAASSPRTRTGSTGAGTGGAGGARGATSGGQRSNVHISVLVAGLRKLLGTRGILYLGLWRRLNRLQKDANTTIAANAAVLVARLRSRLITTHRIAFSDSNRDHDEPPHLFLPPPAALDIPTARALERPAAPLSIPGNSLTFRSRSRRRMLSSNMSVGDLPSQFLSPRGSSGPTNSRLHATAEHRSTRSVSSQGGRPPLFVGSASDHLQPTVGSEESSSYGSYTIRGRAQAGAGQPPSLQTSNSAAAFGASGRSVSLDQASRSTFGGLQLQSQGQRRAVVPSSGWDIQTLGVLASNERRPRGGSLNSPDIGAMPPSNIIADKSQSKNKRKKTDLSVALLDADVLRVVAFGNEEALGLESSLFEWHSYDFAKVSVLRHAAIRNHPSHCMIGFNLAFHLCLCCAALAEVFFFLCCRGPRVETSRHCEHKAPANGVGSG